MIKNLKHISISKDTTLHQAMIQLDNLRGYSDLVLIVTDAQNVVVGTLTDGDIRRQISKYPDLTARVETCYNKSFHSIQTHDNYVDLKAFKKLGINILPRMNADGTLNSVMDLREKQAILPLDCVIMAGGRGKRLSPLTDKIPKPMLQLGGVPIIERNILLLKSYGIVNIYISVNYLADQIVEYFGDGSAFGVKIEYLYESRPLGTAGAIRQLKDRLDRDLIVMNSDLLTNIDLLKMYQKFINKCSDIVIASTEYRVDIPFAIMETDKSRLSRIREKPVLIHEINAGIYILQNRILEMIPNETFYDFPDLIGAVLASGGLIDTDVIHGYWIDIGNKDDYQKAQVLVNHLS